MVDRVKWNLEGDGKEPPKPKEPEMRKATATLALLASYGITVNKTAAGWTLNKMGVQLDAPQATKRDAMSVGVAYALGYMA